MTTREARELANMLRGWKARLTTTTSAALGYPPPMVVTNVARELEETAQFLDTHQQLRVHAVRGL